MYTRRSPIEPGARSSSSRFQDIQLSHSSSDRKMREANQLQAISDGGVDGNDSTNREELTTAW
ncbi:MAG: hypothetical protein WA900_10955 [Casimicrobiaceae bacterium]